MAARDQAIRLMRTDWTDKTQLLAEELYLMWLSLADSLEKGESIAARPSSNGVDWFPTSGGIPVPPNLDDPDFPQAPGVDIIESPGSDPGTSVRITISRVWIRTGGIPARVLSGSGNVYTCILYPNGHDQEGFIVEGVLQLQIDPSETIPPGTWVTGGVYRATLLKVTTNQVIQNSTGAVLNTTTSAEIIHRTHSMQVPVWLS